MVIKSVRRQDAARVLLWCGIGAVIAPAAYAQAPAAAPGAGATTANLETVLVTGSHIPRVQAEGPAPVTAITAADIRANGYATMADVMSALTQNLGALDNNQDTNGFTPGAQAVDLRGLGPNHTLVLVNGRRMASYPQSYGGNSNFTDISNIPVSMVERVEVLSGSASAIYGSDAIAGVINFILKQHVEETTVDLRLGNTQHGGGTSERFALTSGYNNGPLEAVFGVELYNQQPVWAYQRSFTDSRQDSPADPSRIYASPVFTRIDGDDNYIDPGKATCDRLSALDHGSITARSSMRIAGITATTVAATRTSATGRCRTAASPSTSTVRARTSSVTWRASSSTSRRAVPGRRSTTRRCSGRTATR